MLRLFVFAVVRSAELSLLIRHLLSNPRYKTPDAVFADIGRAEWGGSGLGASCNESHLPFSPSLLALGRGQELKTALAKPKG